MTPGSTSMSMEGSASMAAIARVTAPHISAGLDRRPAAASSDGTAPAPMIARYHQYGVLPWSRMLAMYTQTYAATQTAKPSASSRTLTS